MSRLSLRQIRPRGESLVEVIIAITILTTVFAGVFTTLMKASAANTNVINRTVALNIAREGVEAVRNIRDTNWLKYSGDRRKKWLCLDTIEFLADGKLDTDNSNLNACEESNVVSITSGVYAVDFIDHEEGSGANQIKIARYFLKRISGASFDENTPEILPDEDDGFRLYTGVVNGRFTHTITEEPLPFYRQVWLEPEDDWVTDSCDTDGCPRNVRLRVLVRVQWEEGGGVRFVDLETFLYDFLGRESY